jgi:hypothetical protein
LNNKALSSRLAFVFYSLAFTPCAISQSINESPAADPPQLVPSGERDKSGRELLTWDRPEAFGKVPADKRILGNATCLTASADLEAIGYHPRAKDRSGREMPGGGFFCAVKADGDRPAATPPRLTQINGIVGWDNPAAFGAVPADLKARGDAICRKAGSNLEAIAYHPQARGTQNEAIFGGGFFCGPRKASSPGTVQENLDSPARITEAVEPPDSRFSAPGATPKSSASSANGSSQSAAPTSAASAAAAEPVGVPPASGVIGNEAPTTVRSPKNPDAIPAGFYVQHKASGKRQVVERFLSNNPSLKQARIVELIRIGAEGPNFVLLSGPFVTLSQAWAFMKTPGLPKDMWVREASKIRPLLPPAR